MKVPYSWLKDYIHLTLSAKEMARRFTMAGLEVTSLQGYGDDYVFDIEVTPNRPDCLSVIGIAREAAAITGSRLKAKGSRVRIKPYVSHLPSPEFNIKIEDKKGCPLYIGWLIKGVRVGPSPSWLVKRLSACGIRPINNIVDITNYTSLEMGQPLHAFDLERLVGGKILVRRAKKGERILTINNIDYQLSESDLIIADTIKPVAIAGIMGGEGSEVTNRTKAIILESAYFDPILVRRTARRLGLTSESSYRFERGVDIEGVETASIRAVQLVLRLAGGNSVYSIKRPASIKKKRSDVITLRMARMNNILGMDIPLKDAKRILTSLGFRSNTRDRTLMAEIPSFRRDIAGEIDLIEEVARIYGYDRLPASLPFMKGNIIPRDTAGNISGIIKDILIGLGLNESITFSLISYNLNNIFGYRDRIPVRISNPLSAEQEVLRPSILPGLIGAIAHNLNRQVAEIKLFEIGNIFVTRPSGIDEKTGLAIAISDHDFFHLKGIVEALFEALRISHYAIEYGQCPHLSSQSCADIKVGTKRIGAVGLLSHDILKAFDITKKVYVCEINLDDLLPSLKRDVRFSKIPRYPAQLRDISLEVDDNIMYVKIASLIRETGSPLVKDVRLFDYYKGPQIAAGKKSLAYSIEYREDERTLTDEEVDKVHRQICERLTNELGARIR